MNMKKLNLKEEGAKDHKYCLRCGRKLKNPESRIRGYGVICEKKMLVDNRYRLFTI